MIFGTQILEILMRLPVLCLVFIVHEYAHGYVAYKLGDDTAKRDGRLTFNPLKHIDPIGMLCLLIFRFGWAKPVMVNPANLKKPKRDMALISFAGPASNILFALAVGVIWTPFSLVVSNAIVVALVHELILLNLVLAVFNMIPIPPLDGSKVLTVFLSEDNYFKFQEVVGRYGFVILLILIMSGATQIVIFPAVMTLYSGLMSLLEFLPHILDYMQPVFI